MSLAVIRSTASDGEFLVPQSAVWSGATWSSFDMFPAPLSMAEAASPFVARSTDHGSIRCIEAAALHNGRTLAIALRWDAEAHTEISDLDKFVDGVSVLFPLARTATVMTMGSPDAPVNGWLWRANRVAPIEVIGEGFASVRRLPTDESGDLAVAAHHDGTKWQVVFRRSLSSQDGRRRFLAGQSRRIAFAAWNGGNSERSGRKSISGDFVDFNLAR